MNAWLNKNPSQAFWLVLLAHFLLWTIIPTLTQSNAPLDTIEGLAWGREWPLGTYKHPPLQAWLLEAATYLFGQSGLGYYGLSALFTGLALWSVYQTGLLFLQKHEALVATLLSQSIFYVNLLSPEFNPNVLQLGLGAFCSYAFAHALIKGQAKYWLLLGLCFGIGLYAKYSFAIFGISFFAFMVFVGPARALLFRPTTYMALVAAIFIFLPHFLWLSQNNYLPFTYAQSRTEQAMSWWHHIYYPLKFFGAQLLAMLFMIGLAVSAFFPFLRKSTPRDVQGQLLFWLAWGPLFLTLLMAGFTGTKLRDMWGMSLLTFIPLWLTWLFKFSENRLAFFFKVWGGVASLCLFAFAFNLLFAPALGFKPLRGHFPGQDISTYLHGQWAEITNNAPLEYVVGNAWDAGNVAFYAPSTRTRPHVWIDAAKLTSPWIRREDVQQKGALVVWQIKDPIHPTPPSWVHNFKSLKIQKPIIFQWKTKTDYPPIVIGWGVIKPY